MLAPSWPTVTTTLTTIIIFANALFGIDATPTRNFTIPTTSTQVTSAETFLPVLATANDEITSVSSELRSLVPAFHSALDLCPVLCHVAGHSPSNWTIYHDMERLDWCNQTMLLDFAIHNTLSDPSTHVTLRSCSVGDHGKSIESPSLPGKELLAFTPSMSNVKGTQTSMQAASVGALSQTYGAVMATIADPILDYLSQANPSNDSTVLFARSGSKTIGIYVGSQIQAQGVSFKVLEQFIDDLQQNGAPENYLVQLCGLSHGDNAFTLGIAATVDASLDFVQQAASKWSEGGCLTTYSSQTLELFSWNNVTLWLPSSSNNITQSIRNNTKNPSMGKRGIQPRDGDCTSIVVASGDDCGKLASRCGISGFDFELYNSLFHLSLCATLAPGEHVCCTSGTLPDLAPKENTDGTCASYLVVADDSCSKLAGLYSLTDFQIENYNKKTWGWNGCDNLQIGIKMCLSTGKPPFPPPVANALCGPQVVGTLPSPIEDPSDLNPCPLNACCNIWGQCGTTSEFCVNSTAITGAPGTAEMGSNGCISNCGVEIVPDNTPHKFKKIGYFEGFNYQRPCLTMDLSDVNTANYTHIHLAFATITSDFQVNSSVIQDQLDIWADMKGFRKIVSFGGWSFSTEANTYPIFREGVTAANRATFISNLVDFLNENELDGLDFDWEYPGAPDIPGVPAGSPQDGTNYLAFLTDLRVALPGEKEISIAAPASYWYLKGFPIDKISSVVNYIVFMTYDLHGQWDYGNKFANPGCPTGNCLRSHVNITETVNALSMITKAGVLAHKVIVGIASYGRSFEMSQAGCHTELCTFTGTLSRATPGRCTRTAGYIAGGEIDEIIATGTGVNFNHVDGSMSNILVYNDTQWVSYMDAENRAARIIAFQALHLGGTVEWAIDLAGNSSGEYLSPVDFDYDEDEGIKPLCDFTLSFTSLADVEAVADQYGSYCAEIYALKALSSELKGAYSNYTDVDNGYDKVFGYYVKHVKETVKPTLQKFMHSSHRYDETGYGPQISVDGPGNKYFDCIRHRGSTIDAPAPCPLQRTPYSKVFYVLKDEDGFKKDLLDNYGIPSSWVDFGEDNPELCDIGLHPPCRKYLSGEGFPIPKTDISVPNPKDTIVQAIANMTVLQNKLDATSMDLVLTQWGGSGLDAVQVFALPVAMIQQAVDSMKTAKATAEQEKKDEAMNTIMTVLTVIFAVIPFVGEEAATALGAANIARMIMIGGEVANAGLTGYDIYKDPGGAPLAIFGMLLGARGLGRNKDEFATVGKKTEGMKPEDVAKFGKIYEDKFASINKIAQKCAA